MTEQIEREAFEVWVLANYLTVSREYGKLRWYDPSVGSAVGHAWEAWKARAAIQALAPVPTVLYSDLLSCDITPRALSNPLSDYHKAPSEGPLNFTWTDKPHRLLYDLIAAVRYYAAAPQPAQQADTESPCACWPGRLCNRSKACAQQAAQQECAPYLKGILK